jgi:hypothetical protein
MKKRFVRRAYENVALVAVRKERVITLFWARRCRKSTNLGAIAFDEMSKEAGRTVIAASASLLLGTELVNMTVSAPSRPLSLRKKRQRSAPCLRTMPTNKTQLRSREF